MTEPSINSKIRLTSVSQERLKELLSYNPETGIFTRLSARSGQDKGSVAGGLNDQGYVKISIDNKIYRAHRLAWLYMTGEWPEDQIDHINNIRSDNRFSNIRQATHSENNRNTGLSISNKSGSKGVSWSKWHNKWRARINIDKSIAESQGLKTKYKSLGFFESKREATNAYKAACNIYHGEFARAS